MKNLDHNLPQNNGIKRMKKAITSLVGEHNMSFCVKVGKREAVICAIFIICNLTKIIPSKKGKTCIICIIVLQID